MFQYLLTKKVGSKYSLLSAHIDMYIFLFLSLDVCMCFFYALFTLE